MFTEEDGTIINNDTMKPGRILNKKKMLQFTQFCKF